MTSLNDRPQALTNRLAELDTRLQKIEEELEGHDTRDWEDLATEREEDEVLERMGTRGQAEIAMIKAAQARIDAGEYGDCVTCAEPISAERLDVLPHTPFC